MRTTWLSHRMAAHCGGQCPGMVTGEGTRLGLGSKSALGIKLGIRVKVRVGSASGLGVRVGVRVGVKNEVC